MHGLELDLDIKNVRLDHLVFFCLAFCSNSFIAFGTTPATERMPEMLKIFQEVFGSTPHGLGYPITDAEFKGRYYQAACNLQCFSASINPFHR